MKNATMDKLFKGIDYLTGILTGLMVLFVFMNVVLRTCFNSGLTWSEELSRYLFVFVTYVGAISAMRVNGHLGVDTLISQVPRPLQMVMYVVSQLVIAALMCILVHGSGKMVSILMGVAIGVLNGVLVAIMDLPAFLATLCTSMIARGIGTIVVGGFGIPWPVAGSPEGWFRNIFKIKTDGMNIPIGFLWIILLVILMTFVLNHTRIGRYTLAIGSNKEATRLSGVNVKFYHIMAYVICGFFAGLAAISYSAIFATVQPGSGAGFELEAIGGAIIGGVSMTGGVGSITGTLAGVFVICLLKTGLPFIGLTANWQQIITGFVLIAAVLIDIFKRKKEAA